MSDLISAFGISASGMEVQKIRLDTAALNLANASTTRANGGGPFKRLEVIVGERAFQTFESHLTGWISGGGAEVRQIRPVDAPPRLIFEPDHPDADERGFVAYPNINPVSEMVDLIEITRAYEANVRAVNAAKTMALRALQIGTSR